MTESHPTLGIPMSAQQYAIEWAKSAEAFSDAGHHAWMNEQLGNADYVLEVGCGSGKSTECLASSGKKVLSVDANNFCIEQCTARLLENGISTEHINIKSCQSLFPWTGAQVKLVAEDILSEQLLAVLQKATFDAIVCWFVGTHPAHIGAKLGKSLLEFDGSEMAKYREAVQLRCYDVGRKVLKPTGLVHITDRAAIRSWSDKDELRNDLANSQAKIGGTDFEITKANCFLRKLTDGLNQSSIQYVGKLPSGAAGVLVVTSSKARRR